MRWAGRAGTQGSAPGEEAGAAVLLFHGENLRATLPNNRSMGASCSRDQIPVLGIPAPSIVASATAGATPLNQLVQGHRRAIRPLHGHPCWHLHSNKDGDHKRGGQGQIHPLHQVWGGGQVPAAACKDEQKWGHWVEGSPSGRGAHEQGRCWDRAPPGQGARRATPASGLSSSLCWMQLVGCRSVSKRGPVHTFRSADTHKPTCM